MLTHVRLPYVMWITYDILTVFTTVYIVPNSYTLFGYISVYSYQYIISAHELYIIHNYYRLCD